MKGKSPAMGVAYERMGAERASVPILLSVPHAGRDYPPSILERSRVSAETLLRLEDRLVDLLIGDLVARGYPALVARVPRAVIDLNRDPRDIDAQMVVDMPRDHPLIRTAKQRGGLGLFPRFLPRAGDLWRGAMGWEEARMRIGQVHDAYHEAIATEMAALVRDHGQALLIDIHSMPPLAADGQGMRTDVVIGDRFGASAAAHLADAARSVVRQRGLVPALNHPYPGFYLLERHGKPANGRHALQIEISRDLYLDTGQSAPGEGLVRTRAMLTALVEELARSMSRDGLAMAAE